MAPDPRTATDVPPELEVALRTDGTARTHFDSLSPSHRRECIGYIAEAKKPETRVRRAQRTVEMLREQATGER